MRSTGGLRSKYALFCLGAYWHTCMWSPFPADGLGLSGTQGAAFLIHPQGRSSVLVYIVPGVDLESPHALAEQDEWELAKRGTLLREKLKTSRTQLQYPSGTWK